MPACGTCGGDKKCRTCWGVGFIYVKGQRVDCDPNCGTCGGTGLADEPTGSPSSGKPYGAGGKGGKK